MSTCSRRAERGEPRHRDRPAGDVAAPFAHAVAGGEPLHRDDVQGRARVGELGGER